jgi:hypothetical protein
MKSLEWSLGVCFVLVLAGIAVGQNNAPTAYPPDAPIAAVMTSSPFLGAGAGHAVYGVQGSPFSADMDYEFTQVLAGDNHIHRESHGKIFRDGEGRIRNEIEPETPRGPSVLMTTITINDPVSQTVITWHPHAVPKSAVVNHVVVYKDGAGRENGVGFAADNSPASGSGSSRPPAEMLELLRSLHPAQSTIPAATRQHPALLREDLGEKEIEGFMASGIRYSNTTPAGKIGNEKPMVTVNEIWWSKDLKAVLVSIYDDPQSGRRTMRLTNIQVGEPDSQLFQIPPDYTIRELPATSKTTGKPSQ